MNSRLSQKQAYVYIHGISSKNKNYCKYDPIVKIEKFFPSKQSFNEAFRDKTAASYKVPRILF